MKFYASQSGFSLVETLVAITILLLVIIGPMTISSRTAKSTSFASEQAVAFFLAQEGAEIAQKARDDLLLLERNGSGNGWDDFTDVNGQYDECFNISGDDPYGCGLTLNTDATGSVSNPISCPITSCQLYFNDSVGAVRSRYTHSSADGDQTLFSRQIFFEEKSAYEIQVISRVTWRTGSLSADQVVEVETYLFNVYE